MPLVTSTITTRGSGVHLDQSKPQVTNLSTSLSDTFYVSRPVSSIGMVNHGKVMAEGPAYAHQRGKATPVDPFTAEGVKITYDDWLPILEQGAIWNEWTPKDTYTDTVGWSPKWESFARMEVTVKPTK